MLSAGDFEELKGCVEMLNLRLCEHRERDNPHGEALGRAEQELERLKAIIRHLDELPAACLNG